MGVLYAAGEGLALLRYAYEKRWHDDRPGETHAGADPSGQAPPLPPPRLHDPGYDA